LKDYNLPPTEEFKMLTNSERTKHIPNYWLTMMKAVMNDYYFDCLIDEDFLDCWRDEDFLDHFFHKLYYCWLMEIKTKKDWVWEEE
jgi:hypothetical protein